MSSTPLIAPLAATTPDAVAAATTPPGLDHRHALFLDFDGTLVEIAAQPQDVQLPARLLDLLQALQQALDGALAIITGRTVESIGTLLSPLQLALAGEHGAALCSHDGPISADPTPDLGEIAQLLQDFVRSRPGLLLECKGHGLALHYRGAPHLEADCLALASQLIRARPDLVLLHGKAVVELKSARVDKGRALQTLMNMPPFRGRIPVFIGDDTTDEAAIVQAQALGGYGIKVGSGPSAAQYRLADPAQVLDYLDRVCRQWQSPAPQPR
jgi:trehalose 6-phosphate phosphatase